MLSGGSRDFKIGLLWRKGVNVEEFDTSSRETRFGYGVWRNLEYVECTKVNLKDELLIDFDAFWRGSGISKMGFKMSRILIRAAGKRDLDVMFGLIWDMLNVGRPTWMQS